MKKLIDKLFFIPIIISSVGVILFTLFFFFFLQSITKIQFNKINQLVINNQKKILKNSMDAVINAAKNIRVSIFDATTSVMKKILLNHKNSFKYTHKNGMYFFNDKMVKKSYYLNVGNKKFLIVEISNKKYLAVTDKKGNGYIGIGIRLDEIEKWAKEDILNYVKMLNKQTGLSYIAVSKIFEWGLKDGVFGITIYHPIKLFVGKPLILEKPDAKGKEYRREYYTCLEKRNGCFVEYYFNNPQTQKPEKKLSYFTIFRPYNWVFLRGFYFSQITKEIISVKEEFIKEVKFFLVITIFMLILLSIASFIISYYISRKILKKIVEDYNYLKSEYEKSKLELVKRYYYDRLTNLPNRNKLIEDINVFNSVIIIDIDDFSHINDIYGFEFGNRLLNYFKDILKSEYKYVYRVGSDEFALPLKREVSENELIELSKKVVIFEKVNVKFTIGASNIKNRLFETAESALKFALKDSSKRYMLYDEKFLSFHKEKLEKLLILHEVLEKRSIEPFYQCIVNQKGEVVKYESLMRIIYENKIYSPFFFLELMKEAKLYDQFSRLMIERVFESLSEFDVPISINLSFDDVVNEETKNLIFEMLNKKDPNKVVIFEILESESVMDFNLMIEFIKRVKEKNVKIAIDDFGSGYSNFINILQLSPDVVKIDSSLGKNIHDPKYSEIVKLIVKFSHSFNIKTTAEFVADKEIFEKLVALGVDEFQGFYFCKPSPIH